MPKISRNAAVTLVKDLRNMGINEEGIRSRLTSEGFSYSEARDLINNLPKRKNDDAQGFSYDFKSKNDYRTIERFERGGCLTAWLSFQVIAIVISLFAICALFGQVNSYNNSSDGGLAFVAFILLAVSVFQLMCVAWLWDGQRKGYQGILVLYVVSIVLSLLTGQFASVGTSVVGMVIIFSLVNPKEHLLK